MVSLVRSLTYITVFYIGSVLIVSGAALAGLIGRSALVRMARVWSRYHYWCVRYLLGIQVVVEGKLPQTGAIVAIKHESALDTIELLRLFHLPAVVMKAELFDIPVWGWVAAMHGSIPVARETGATALRRMLRAARDAIADDRPIIIFPEGSRVLHGERPAIKPGIVGIYKSLRVPIVPVALDSGRLWKRGELAKRAGIVTFRVGEAIPPGLDREEVEARIHAGINALNA